jgi:site-specific DNA-cytosine methylase
VGPAIEDTLRDDAIPSGWCSEANQSAADYRVVKSLDRPISTITAGSENSHGASCLALTFGAPEGETIPVGAPRVKPPAKADPRIAALAGSEPTLLDQPSAPVLARDGKGTSISPSSLGRSMITSASDSAYLGAGIRRLTVEECAILQAFPADYPWRGTKTAQYRQVGNAVCPPVAEALVRAVLDQHPDQLRGRIEQFPADPPPLVGGELPPAR